MSILTDFFLFQVHCHSNSTLAVEIAQLTDPSVLYHFAVGLGSVIGAGLDKFGKVVQPTEAWERLCRAYDALPPHNLWERISESLWINFDVRFSLFNLNQTNLRQAQFTGQNTRIRVGTKWKTLPHGSDSPAVGPGPGFMECLVDLRLVIACSHMSSSQQQDPAHTDFKEGASAVVKVGGAVPRNCASGKHQQRGEDLIPWVKMRFSTGRVIRRHESRRTEASSRGDEFPIDLFIGTDVGMLASRSSERKCSRALKSVREAKGFGKSISAHSMSWTNGAGSRQVYVSLCWKAEPSSPRSEKEDPQFASKDIVSVRNFDWSTSEEVETEHPGASRAEEKESLRLMVMKAPILMRILWCMLVPHQRRLFVQKSLVMGDHKTIPVGISKPELVLNPPVIHKRGFNQFWLRDAHWNGLVVTPSVTGGIQDLISLHNQ
ncbi:hypothetical protein B0H19DRAFT_1082731 [Mycena capillaripes]|nr:hypothetical protein B0H19DRAFT_1082731 [Mycena capillaripes]